MDNKERLQLNKLIKANNVEDVTQEIRDKKHSHKIRDDIRQMQYLKQEYARMSKSNPTSFNAMLESKCSFLFTNYTDIFNRIKKNELDMQIMAKFLLTLERIENEEIDQHEGAYAIGTLLKNIYIDSAIKRGDNLDKKYGNKKVPKKPNNMKAKLSWEQYKSMQDTK